MTVTPPYFVEQLDVLWEHARVIRLQKLSWALVDGDLRTRSVVVTFDGEYTDNLYNAKPLLERYSITATVVLTTGYIECGREFWWDEPERVLVQPEALPKVLYLGLNGSTYQ